MGQNRDTCFIGGLLFCEQSDIISIREVLLVKLYRLVSSLYQVDSLAAHSDNQHITETLNCIVQLEKTLSVWKVLQETLEKLHVKRKLEVDKISADDERVLSLIIDCVHDGKLVTLDNPPEPGVYVFEIANLNLLLYLAKGTPLKYYIADIFDFGVMFKVSVDEGSTWTQTCVFSYLRDDRLWQVCDNIDFSAIEKCYDSVQSKEGDFIKVIEDDLRYINFSMNELSQNQTNPSRESELRDAYNRLENWLSDYKQSLV